MKIKDVLDLLLETIIEKEDGWYVVSEKTGKNLGGPYSTIELAKKRLRQVEFFKHNKKKLVKKPASKIKHQNK